MKQDVKHALTWWFFITTVALVVTPPDERTVTHSALVVALTTIGLFVCLVAETMGARREAQR